MCASSDNPTWDLFRTQVRRYWRAAAFARLAGLVVLVVAAQTLATMMVLRANLAASPAGFTPGILPTAFSVLGLYSPVGLAAVRWADMSAAALLVALGTTVGAVQLAVERFVMPAYAGKALAGPRRTECAGADPHRVFIGAGAAALLPFALLTAAGLIVAAAISLILPAYAPPPDSLPREATVEAGMRRLLLFLVVTPIRFALVAALLLSISALCRSARGAVAACYAAGALLLPVASHFALICVTDVVPPGTIPHWRLYASQAVPPALALLALAVLLPESLTALGRETPPAEGADAGILVARAKSEGVLIREVARESLAARAGLRPGDVIVSMDGSRIRDGEDLVRVAARGTARGPRRLAVVRDGAVVSAEVDPRERTGKSGDAEGGTQRR
ncbi:MAG: PDZ domain-containing protein [Armatimonadetes bacterium]|nr:PDZ domain-containing protein [Armatimonadota bacterium]